MTCTFVLSRLEKIATLVALAAAWSPSAHAQAPVSRQGDLMLTLACRDSARIRFEVRNVGATDTTLRLGSVLGNGRKYTIDSLHLLQKMPAGQVTEQHYWPHDYPGVIGGLLGEWVEAIPARASYSVSAEASDFINDVSGRLVTFTAGAELSLRLTILAPREQGMLPVYWSGILTSNACAPVP